MSDLEKENKLLRDLIKNAFSLEFNMNDVWMWACADSQEIDSGDVLALIPYVEKYGYDAVIALSSIYMEVETGNIIHPQDPVITDEYHAARKEIMSELEDPDKKSFFQLRYDRDKKIGELEKYGEEVLHWGIAKKPGLQVIILELKEKGVFGIGTNQVGAYQDLDDKLKLYKAEKERILKERNGQ